MKKLILIAFSGLSLFLNAQTALPYYTGFDNTQEINGWNQYRKGDASLYEWNIHSFGPYSAPNSLTHNYPVGGSQPTIDWFVSPEFDFSNGGTIDSIRYLFSGFGTPQNGDTVAIFLLNGSPDPDLATSLINIKEYRGADYNNDNIWRVDTGLVIPAITGESYIAFKYITVVNWLDVKFDNLAISGNIGAGVGLTLMDNFKIYPNPASDHINIEMANQNDYEAELYDITGKLIQKLTILSGKGVVDLSNIKKGIVTLRLFDDEMIYTKKLIVY